MTIPAHIRAAITQATIQFATGAVSVRPEGLSYEERQEWAREWAIHMKYLMGADDESGGEVERACVPVGSVSPPRTFDGAEYIAKNFTRNTPPAVRAHGGA